VKNYLLLILLIPFSISAQSSTLKQQASKRNILFGTAVGTKDLLKYPEYKEKIKEEFSIITPEVALKFKHTETDRNKYDFTEADTILDFAAANNILVRGHTLVWHHNLPDWLIKGSFTPEELTKILHKHIKNVVSHCREKYPNRVVYWDVVNEAIDKKGEFKSNSIWKVIGSEPDDCIRLPFQWAHEADPDAKLFYNECDIYDLGTKSTAVYKLIKKLKAEGVPIHGIGFQLHLKQGQKINWDLLKKNFDRFAALGLEIHITELDYASKVSDGPVSKSMLREQAKIYAKAVKTCLAVPSCRAIITWGFSDKNSYVSEWPGYNTAFYFDESFKPKPAYNSMIEALKR
jgi:endo-1,4-beta-xylanase